MKIHEKAPSSQQRFRLQVTAAQGASVIADRYSHRGNLMRRRSARQNHVRLHRQLGGRNTRPNIPFAARHESCGTSARPSDDLRACHPPLSDHADYDELLEAVRQVDAQEIYCTHGPESFADDLRGLGFNARPLANARQMQLF